MGSLATLLKHCSSQVWPAVTAQTWRWSRLVEQLLGSAPATGGLAVQGQGLMPPPLLGEVMRLIRLQGTT